MADKILKVSKIAAARSQLDCAIDLWFRDADPISIHTLVFASYEIIQDLNLKNGNKELTLLGMAKRRVKPEHVEEAMALLRAPMTFFKHANRDPAGVIDFQPESNEFIFVFCMAGLEALGEQPTDLQRVLVLWHSLHRPEIFLEGKNIVNETLDVNAVSQMKTLGKREFLKSALQGQVLARIRD